MSAEFGPLVRAAMRDKHLSQGKTAALVGVYDDGRYLDATQMRLIMTGGRKPTRGLVQRLVDVLAPYLDPAEAWAAAGLLPPGVTADMLRQLDLVAAQSNVVTPEYLVLAGQLALPTDLDPELIARLRPSDELAWWRERRDRRQRFGRRAGDRRKAAS